MNRKGSEEVNSNPKSSKYDKKTRKPHRSTSNNKVATKNEKYKQNDTSGPITAKNPKLPDAFLDVNYKGKRSMKLIKQKHDKRRPDVVINDAETRHKQSNSKSK